MSSSSEVIRHGYATIRAVLDERRGRAVVIGVAAWDADANWFNVRTLAPAERVSLVTPDVRSFADIALRQIRRWADQSAVPYAPAPMAPWTSGFWQAVSRVMTTAIRVDTPRAMAPMRDRALEFESLFEAVVQPAVPAPEKKKRIAGYVRAALGSTSAKLKPGATFRAFGGVEEPVLRGAVGASGAVLVEGVNLAGAHARRDADALASRLLRIRDGMLDSHLSMVVGYVASPGGLNGEADMRDWIREKVTPDVYDLASEGEQFRDAAESGLQAAGLAV